MTPQLISGTRFHSMGLRNEDIQAATIVGFLRRRQKRLSQSQKRFFLHVAQTAESPSSFLRDDEPTPKTLSRFPASMETHL